eukprot:m.484451 g.484451  ORF g.484451 m.484451 type:complete len:73 (+) comp21731_c3_seq10:2472-2690(+)
MPLFCIFTHKHTHTLHTVTPIATHGHPQCSAQGDNSHDSFDSHDFTTENVYKLVLDSRVCQAQQSCYWMKLY